MMDTTQQHLREADGLAAVLDAAYSAFEGMLSVIYPVQDPASGLFAAFVMAAASAANGRAAPKPDRSPSELFGDYCAQNGIVDARVRAEAFYTLIERIHTDDVTLVAVPDPTHLEHLACLTGADLHAASRHLRVQILLLHAVADR